MNNAVKYFIFVILVFMSSLSYSFANFSETNHKQNVDIISIDFLPLIAISLGYAFFEYVLKIPGYYLVKDLLSPIELQMVWLLFTYFSVILFQKFFLKKEIQFHSCVSFSLILLILIIDAQFRK